MPFGLGGNQRPIDERDFHLGSYQPPVAIPAVYKPDISTIPVKMQGQYGSCGAHAGSMLDSILQTLKREMVQDLSPKFLWKEIKTFDTYSLEQGTDMRSIMKALQTMGDCSEQSLPNVLDPTAEQYADASVLTLTEKQEAGQNAIGHYAFIDNPTFDQIKQAIFQNKAVIGLLRVSDAWWLPSWTDPTLFPLKFTQMVGGHFVVFYGYDEKYIYFRNSWSSQWGNQGDGYFDASYVQYINELGTTLTLPAPYIFTTDLQKGLVSPAVAQLQKRLNQRPETQIAASGAGSPGHETTTFGALTFAAVKKYQTLNKLPSTGYVGSLTRTLLNTTK